MSGRSGRTSSTPGRLSGVPQPSTPRQRLARRARNVRATQRRPGVRAPSANLAGSQRPGGLPVGRNGRARNRALRRAGTSTTARHLRTGGILAARADDPDARAWMSGREESPVGARLLRDDGDGGAFGPGAVFAVGGVRIGDALPVSERPEQAGTIVPRLVAGDVAAADMTDDATDAGPSGHHVTERAEGPPRADVAASTAPAARRGPDARRTPRTAALGRPAGSSRWAP